MFANYDGRELATGTIVTLVAIVLLFLFYTSTRGAGVTGYELIAHFSRADGLSIGSEVRIAGVNVGRVSGLELNPANFLATVRMKIDRGIQIPAGASINCTSDGLLGSVHLDITPGHEKNVMRSGDVIAKSQSCSADVMSLVGQVGLSPRATQPQSPPKSP